MNFLQTPFNIFIIFLSLFTLSSLATPTARVDNLHEKQNELTPISTRTIDSLDLSTRIKNALKASGINYLGMLLRMTEQDLLRIPGIGKKGLAEIKIFFKQHGLVDKCLLTWK